VVYTCIREALMAEVADVATDVEYGGRAHPLLHLLAPLVAAVAVWVARAGIGITYERVSGRKRPIPSDPETSWGQAIVWTAMTATTAAVIEVAVRRIANKRQVHDILRRGRAASEVVTRRHGGPAGAAQALRLGPGWRVGGARSGQRMPVSVSSTLKELADETSSS
jgi:Protein of unknown function (DUF4235)